MEALRNCEPCCGMPAKCAPLCLEKPKKRRAQTTAYLAAALVLALAASAALALGPVSQNAGLAKPAVPAANAAIAPNAAQNDLGALTVEEAAQYLASAETVLKVDVSMPRAYVNGHLDQAATVPVAFLSEGGLAQLLSALPADMPVLVYASDASDASLVYEALKAQRADIPSIAYVEGQIDLAALNG